MRRLTNYAWPGNIRELQNVIERAVILSSGPTLTLDREQLLVPLAAAAPSDPRSSASSTESASLSDVERCHIQSILEQTGWVIEGARGAARILSLHPNPLRFRMKKLGSFVLTERADAAAKRVYGRVNRETAGAVRV